MFDASHVPSDNEDLAVLASTSVSTAAGAVQMATA